MYFLMTALSVIPSIVICAWRMRREKSICGYLATAIVLFSPQVIYFISRAIKANGHDVGELAIIIGFILPYFFLVAIITMTVGSIKIAKRNDRELKDETH